MSITEAVSRLERIPGALAGRGPRHPEAPDLSIENQLVQFLDTYPALRRDVGYVEFLEKYAGAMIKNAGETQIVDLLGFSDVSTGMLEMDGPVVDENGFLLFAQCIFHVIVEGGLVDMYEYDFAFDAYGERPPGVYRCSATLRSHGEPYVWYADGFCSWLVELVDQGGRYERPALD
ncbi:MAG: hypothetical protein ACRDRT_01920 [Pseudonocardiaceae bacterium]